MGIDFEDIEKVAEFLAGLGGVFLKVTGFNPYDLGIRFFVQLMKSQGISEEEAKAGFIAEAKKMKILPMDFD